MCLAQYTQAGVFQRKLHNESVDQSNRPRVGEKLPQEYTLFWPEGLFSDDLHR